jgi:hypothetical protein
LTGRHWLWYRRRDMMSSGVRGMDRLRLAEGKGLQRSDGGSLSDYIGKDGVHTT